MEKRKFIRGLDGRDYFIGDDNKVFTYDENREIQYFGDYTGQIDFWSNNDKKADRRISLYSAIITAVAAIIAALLSGIAVTINNNFKLCDLAACSTTDIQTAVANWSTPVSVVATGIPNSTPDIAATQTAFSLTQTVVPSQVIPTLIFIATQIPFSLQQTLTVNTVTSPASSIPGCNPVPPELNTPLRPHQIYNVGSGIFERATQSDGMYEFSGNDRLANHPCVDFINPGIERSNGASNIGCIISPFNVSRIWFSNSGNTALTIRRTGTNIVENLGEFEAGQYPHGFILPLNINIGDEICLTSPTNLIGQGFHVWLGPDLYSHSDSYCVNFPSQCPNRYSG